MYKAVHQIVYQSCTRLYIKSCINHEQGCTSNRVPIMYKDVLKFSIQKYNNTMHLCTKLVNHLRFDPLASALGLHPKTVLLDP
jgi:hypothetical protein